MARKFAPWYTKEHWQKPTPEDAVTYERVFGHKPIKLVYKSKDGTLFSKSIYPTKIIVADLPPSFVSARIDSLWGYYDASAIIGAAYKPDLWANHLFKYDVLYLSFKHADIDPSDWKSFELILFGWDIVTALAALRVFSSIPESKIISLENEVAAKVRKYMKDYPEELDCVDEGTFWKRLADEKSRLIEQQSKCTN